MADLDTIYDFETALEEALRAALIAMQFKAFTRKNAVVDFQKDRPRVGIKVQIGAANGHYHLLANQEQRLDQFSFNAQLLLVTNPQNVEEDNVLMPQYRARVRGFMATIDKVSRQDLATFPNHCISRIMDSGTEYEFPLDKGVELSTLSYGGIFAIRPTVWP